MPELESPEYHAAIASGTRPKLAVVDDDAEVLAVIATWLESLDCEVQPFSDSVAAAEHLLREHVDGIVSDMYMPGLDGAQLIRAVRDSEVNKKVLVVIVTGSAEAAAMKDCFAAGASLFLPKPVNEAALRRIVNLLRATVLKDHRDSRRLSLVVHVSCRRASQPIPACCVNLSESGMLLEGLTETEVGDRVSLEFDFAPVPQPIKVNGKVVRKDSPTRTAISFCNVPTVYKEAFRQVMKNR